MNQLKKPVVGALAVLMLAATPAKAGAEESKLPDLTKFAAKVEQLLHSYYPNLTRENISSNAICFSADTMKFMIHMPLKTGEWQPAHEEIGPQRKGIRCCLNLSPGRWMGAAAMPQEFDHHYFKVYAMAPYSEKHNCHLHASLYYPDSVKPELLTKYTALIKAFDQSLE